MGKRFCFFVALFCWAVVSMAQSNLLQGNWDGYLKVGTDSLRLVLVVTTERDSLCAVLDSPDQYVTDLLVDRIQFRGDTLSFTAQGIDARFRGIVQADSTIRGTFVQRNRKMRLTLRPHAVRKLFARPQTPQPPFPYLEEELHFATIPPTHGTLTLPAEGRPKAVVVLITGSGRQDRDETIMLHKPFWVWADTLTRAGFAVYRYDDPAAPFFQQMTTADFVVQQHSIIDSLSLHPRLRGVDVGLMGHSEGGLIACMAAAQNPKVAFVISLAGVAEPIKEVLLFQNRQLGIRDSLSELQIEKNTALSLQVYEIMERSKSLEQAKKRLSSFFVQISQKLTEEQRIASHLTPLEVLAMQQQLTTPWFYHLFHLDPADYIKKVRCPIYVLNAEKDRQVNPLTNLPLFARYLQRSPDRTIEQVEGVNHLFQPCEEGFFDEYGEIEQTLAPEVLARVVAWLQTRYPK